MITVLQCLAVLAAWVVGTTGVLVLADRLIKRRRARRAEQAKAEERATRVVLAIDHDDPEALLHALGLIPVVDHRGLPWFDACELDAVQYPAEILSVPRQRDGGRS